jgi:hypothetical protein
MSFIQNKNFILKCSAMLSSSQIWFSKIKFDIVSVKKCFEENYYFKKLRKKHCWCDPSQLAFDGLSKSDIFQFAFQSVCVFVCICVNGCMCACLFVYMPICLSFNFLHFMIVGGLSSVYLIFCLFVSLFVCLSVCLSVSSFLFQSICTTL